jgi:WD40 repeat protein
VRDLQFSKDNLQLVSVSDDLHINLIDVKEQKRVLSLTGHSDWVTCVAFHPEGKVFATGSADHSIKIWDLNSKKCIKTLNSKKICSN